MANNLGTASGSVEINTSGLKNADIALRSAGTSMINFGTQAVRAFGTVVKAAADFEKEMDFVQAVTGASVEQMDKLKDAAIDLAKESIYGPIALSEAFVELAKAGATVEQIIGGVGEAAVALATASDVEIPFAGETLLNIMNAFKLEAADATRVADLLAGAANASSVDLQDLAVSMKYAAPVAAGLGIDIGDLTDALTILGKVGIFGSTAGTSLRQIMLNLSPPTKAAANQMKELGIITEDGSNQFFDAQGNAKSLAEVFGILGESMKDLNNEQKTEALRDLFGVRAIPAALELLAQGEQGFADINAEIERTTAADVAAKRMDNLDGSIKRLKATLEAMFVTAGGPFQKMLKGWVDGLRNVLLFIDSLPGPLKTIIVGAVGLIGVLSILAGAFLLTIGNIVRMVRVAGELTNAFRLLAGGARAASAANSAASASLLLNPWVLAAAAIVAVAAALVYLYFKWKPFRELVDQTWQDIQQLWDGILGFIDDVGAALDRFFQGFSFGGIADSFQEAFSNQGITTELSNIHGVVERLGNALGDAWRSAGQFFQGIIAWLKNLPALASQGLGALGGAIVNVLSSLGGLASQVAGIVAEALSNALDAVIDFVGQLPKRLGYIIGFIIGRVFRLQIDIPKFFFKMFRTIITHLVEWGVQFVKYFGNILKEFATNAFIFFQSLPGRVASFLISMLNHLLTFIPQLASAGYQMGFQFVENLLQFVNGLPNRIFNILEGIVSYLFDLVPRLFNIAWNIGNSILDGIMDVIDGLPQEVYQIADAVIRAFTDLIQDAFNAAKDFAGGLWEGFKDGLGINSPSFIEKAVWNIEGELGKSFGRMQKDMASINGLAGGINPQLNAGSVGLTSAISKTTAPPWMTGAGTNHTYNAPLIGQATIRSEEDIVSLSRHLAEEQAKQERAKGRKSYARS